MSRAGLDTMYQESQQRLQHEINCRIVSNPAIILCCCYSPTLCGKLGYGWPRKIADVDDIVIIIIHHHIRFWYLWCCGCPGLRGRQHLATPHTRSPWIPVQRADTIQVAYSHIICHTCGPRLPWPPTISGARNPQSHDGADAGSGTLHAPAPPKTPSAKNSRDPAHIQPLTKHSRGNLILQPCTADPPDHGTVISAKPSQTGGARGQTRSINGSGQWSVVVLIADNDAVDNVLYRYGRQRRERASRGRFSWRPRYDCWWVFHSLSSF